MQQFRTSEFHKVGRWRGSGEVENVYTAYKVSYFAIYLPKLIKIGWNLTKFWPKQKCTVFWDTVYILS